MRSNSFSEQGAGWLATTAKSGAGVIDAATPEQSELIRFHILCHSHCHSLCHYHCHSHCHSLSQSLSPRLSPLLSSPAVIDAATPEQSELIRFHILCHSHCHSLCHCHCHSHCHSLSQSLSPRLSPLLSPPAVIQGCTSADTLTLLYCATGLHKCQDLRNGTAPTIWTCGTASAASRKRQQVFCLLWCLLGRFSVAVLLSQFLSTHVPCSDAHFCAVSMSPAVSMIVSIQCHNHVYR